MIDPEVRNAIHEDTDAAVNVVLDAMERRLAGLIEQINEAIAGVQTNAVHAALVEADRRYGHLVAKPGMRRIKKVLRDGQGRIIGVDEMDVPWDEAGS